MAQTKSDRSISERGSRRDGLAATGLYIAYIATVIVPVVGLISGLVYLTKRSTDDESAQAEMRHGFLLIVVGIIMGIAWFAVLFA